MMGSPLSRQRIIRCALGLSVTALALVPAACGGGGSGSASSAGRASQPGSSSSSGAPSVLPFTDGPAPGLSSHLPGLCAGTPAEVDLSQPPTPLSRALAREEVRLQTLAGRLSRLHFIPAVTQTLTKRLRKALIDEAMLDARMRADVRRGDDEDLTIGKYQHAVNADVRQAAALSLGVRCLSGA